MKTSKIISKVENYYLHDFNFHEALYECLRECDSKQRVLLLTDKCLDFYQKYSDIDISPNEISCLLSGLFFNSSSFFIDSDFKKTHLSSEEIRNKNEAFNELGKKIGCNGKIFMLLRHSFLTSDDELLNKQLDFLTTEEKNYFFGGRHLKGFELSIEKEHELFWLAGITSTQKGVLTLFNRTYAFETTKILGLGI